MLYVSSSHNTFKWQKELFRWQAVWKFLKKNSLFSYLSIVFFFQNASFTYQNYLEFGWAPVSTLCLFLLLYSSIYYTRYFFSYFPPLFPSRFLFIEALEGEGWRDGEMSYFWWDSGISTSFYRMVGFQIFMGCDISVFYSRDIGIADKHFVLNGMAGSRTFLLFSIHYVWLYKSVTSVRFVLFSVNAYLLISVLTIKEKTSILNFQLNFIFDIHI